MGHAGARGPSLQPPTRIPWGGEEKARGRKQRNILRTEHLPCASPGGALARELITTVGRPDTFVSGNGGSKTLRHFTQGHAAPVWGAGMPARPSASEAHAFFLLGTRSLRKAPDGSPPPLSCLPHRIEVPGRQGSSRGPDLTLLPPAPRRSLGGELSSLQRTMGQAERLGSQSVLLCDLGHFAGLL